MQDNKIKSMLENVEVPAPRRVWRNVSAQLDAAAAPAEAGREWMKWAGMAVAFAALVIGVFVFVPHNSSEEPILTSQNITVAQNAQLPPEEAEPEQILESAAPVAAISAKREYVAAAELSEDAVAPEVFEAPAEPTEVQETPVQPRPAPVEVKDEPDGSAAGVFERMAKEEEKKFSRGIKSLYAQGAIGGNDSDISFSANRARMSSGTSVKKTGITELGESEFGIPISFGVGFRYYVVPKFSIGAGLDYSLLSRTFKGLYEEVENRTVVYSETGTVHHTMHYLGIPVNAYYDIITADRVKFYVYGGGAMEFCLGNNYTLYSSTYINYSSKVDKLQWSVNAGLGVEFKLSTHLGLYLDPSAKYYFHCYQPKNIRTERPLMFNFDAGLRFNF